MSNQGGAGGPGVPLSAPGSLVSILYGLLSVPAFALAFASVMILDAPWSARGVGTTLAFSFILGCWGAAVGLLLAVNAVRWRGRPAGRAALYPVPPLLVLLAVEWSVHRLFHACILWCP
ncbi:hypothetical protein [Azospirillum sp. sgz302134]